MRKVLFTLAACTLCAAPLKAQAVQAAAVDPAAVAAPAPRVHEDAPAAKAPSLYPTTDEVRQQVAAAERDRAQRNAAVPNDFLYLVAAIVVGVVIAALLLG